MKCYFLLSFSFLVLLDEPSTVIAQDANNIRSKCQQELSVIDNKMRDLNEEYENIKSDLKAGLFCSKCGNSKTELDKTEGFYKHLNNVKGEAVAANQQQMNDAHNRYLSKFNSLKSQYESKQKSCNDNYDRAIKEQNQKAERDRQNALQKQQDQLREAQDNAERQRLAEEQRLQQVQQQFEQQQEANRQKILAESEKNKQDAIQMFGDAANRLTNSINSINIPSERIGFNNKAGKASQEDDGRQNKKSVKNVDDYDFENSGMNNNYWDKLSDRVENVLKDEIVSSSKLPEIVKNGIDAFGKFTSYFDVASATLQGRITEETVNTYFSATPNAVIREIQNYSGGVAVRHSNTIMNLTERIFEDDFSEADIHNAINSMNPLHFQPTYRDNPITIKDAIVVIGGGAVLSTVGAPIWLGIGAAAWYGFNR